MIHDQKLDQFDYNSFFIKKWSVLTEIFKKVIVHFDFGAWKWSFRDPKIIFYNT